MADCVMETLCTHCIHREVCSLKTTYLKTLSDLPRVNSDFTVTLSCRNHQREVTKPRTNTFTYSDSTNHIFNSF